MSKNLILKSLILFSFFSTSCHLTGKKQAEQTEDSNRKVAAVDPTVEAIHAGIQKAKKSSFDIVSRPVSKMVVFKNNKPVCQLSAVENRQLVPSYFPVASQDNIQLKLPRCNRRDVSQIQGIKQQAVLLDKKGAYKTAGLPFVPVALCLGGAALGYYISKDWSPGQDIFKAAGAGGVSVISMYIDLIRVPGSSAKVRFVKGALKGTGLAGMCGGVTSLVVYIYNVASRL